MGLIIRLILGLFLISTVLAQTQTRSSIYNRPSLQDKTGEYAIVLSPKGCAAFSYNNGPDSYRYVCWDADAQIFPDYDGYYRITLFTGFTDDPKPAYVHPKYMHDYEWKYHRKVYINGKGCLRPYGDDWGIPDALGPCPPTSYFPNEPDIRNPYNMRYADRLKLIQPIMNGINRYLIKPLFQDQSSIIYPDDTGTDPELGYDFNSPLAAGLDESTAEPPAPVVDQF